MKIVYIELSECILCEICTEMCPSIFRLNEAGFIEIFDVSEGDIAAAQEAIKYCPADCIHWDETAIDNKQKKLEVVSRPQVRSKSKTQADPPSLKKLWRDR